MAFSCDECGYLGDGNCPCFWKEAPCRMCKESTLERRLRDSMCAHCFNEAEKQLRDAKVVPLCPFKGCERAATHNAEFPHPELGTADVDVCEEHAKAGTNAFRVGLHAQVLTVATEKLEAIENVMAAYFRTREPALVAQAIEHLIHKAGFTYDSWTDYQLGSWTTIHPAPEQKENHS